MAIRLLTWCREIKWSDDPIVWVEVEKIEAAWRLDESAYLGPDVRRWPSSGMPYRYKRFGEWISKGSEAIKMSRACLDGGELSFTDGRHRFAWCRDHGVKILPMETNNYSLAKFTARFGAALQRSELPLPIVYSLNDERLAKLREW